jgi:hypothetical protein
MKREAEISECDFSFYWIPYGLDILEVLEVLDGME